MDASLPDAASNYGCRLPMDLLNSVSKVYAGLEGPCNAVYKSICEELDLKEEDSVFIFNLPSCGPEEAVITKEQEALEQGVRRALDVIKLGYELHAAQNGDGDEHNQSEFFSRAKKVAKLLGQTVRRPGSARPSSAGASSLGDSNSWSFRRCFWNQEVSASLDWLVTGRSTTPSSWSSPLTQTREEAISQGRRLLSKRIQALHITEHLMADDGNCLFRAISHQMYGHQDDHEQLRSLAIDQLKTQEVLYRFYFDSEAEYEKYMQDMSVSGMWGDELVLKGICDRLKLLVYVFMSTAGNWYLRYCPHDVEEDALGTLNQCFLSYLSPVHYNSLTYPDNSAITLSPQETHMLPSLRS